MSTKQDTLSTTWDQTFSDPTWTTTTNNTGNIPWTLPRSLSKEEELELQALRARSAAEFKNLKLSKFKELAPTIREVILLNAEADNALDIIKATIAPVSDRESELSQTSGLQSLTSTLHQWTYSVNTTSRLQDIGLTVEDIRRAHAEASMEETLANV